MCPVYTNVHIHYHNNMCAVNTDIDCVKYLLQSADEYTERLNKVDNSILASCPVINKCIPFIL